MAKMVHRVLGIAAIAVVAATCSATSAMAATGVTPAKATPQCTTAQLKGSLGFYQSGGSNRYVRLTLVNVSKHTCVIRGWAGLGLGAGPYHWHTNVVRTLPQDAYTTRLTHGAAVSAQLQWTVKPANTCEPLPLFLNVIPPNQTKALKLSWKYGKVCGHGKIYETPFVPFA